jgi:hypothetical protein
MDDIIKVYHREVGWGCGLDSSGSEKGPLAGSCGCEHDNEF